MRTLFLLTVASLPVSITLHHALVSLCTLYVLYDLFRKRRTPFGGLLTNPIHLFNLSTVASAIIYMPEKLREAFSSSFLRYAYLLPVKGAVRNADFFYTVNRVLVLEGVILIPVFVYNLIFLNRYKLLWGDMFKVAEIYALFTLAAVNLALYRRSPLYSVLAIVFFGIMLAPARRAEILGLLLTLLLIGILYLRHNLRYAKYAVVLTASFLLLVGGAFLHFAGKGSDPRFVYAMEVIKGDRELDEEVLDRISSRRWDNLKAGLVVIGRDVSELNLLPLLIGHGIYSGHKLSPPPPNGLPYYESVVFVQELIQRGILGVAAMVLIFVRSLRLFFSLDLSRREHLLVLSSVSYLVFYNLSSIFTPYVNATFPVALFMFGLAEGYLRGSQDQRR